MMQGFGRDLSLAARRLIATPLFTVFAVLSLAVGVGVTTAVYSVVESIFWKDTGIADPDSAVFLTAPDNGRFSRVRLSKPDYDDFRASQRSFSTVAGTLQVPVAVMLPSRTELSTAEAVDGDYFGTVGVRAAFGRTIEPRDQVEGAEVVVLSHDIWRKQFSADPQIVGRTLRLSGRQFEIIGVADAPFAGASARFGPFNSTLWVPLATAAGFMPAPSPPIDDRDRRQLQVVARLRPGVSVGAAAAEMASVAAALDLSHPQHSEYARRSIAPRRWSAETIGKIEDQGIDVVNRIGLVIVGLVALVLVVACTNLSNLVLARGILRQQEFAVRRALGAPRWRLVREQAAESLLLAAAGSIGSYIVLEGLRTWMTTDFQMDRRWKLAIEPAVDFNALLLAGSAVLLSLLVFGLEPALALTRSRDVKSQLAEGSGSVGVPKARRQRALLRWQVAISAGFFIIATMCVRYTIEELRHESGIDLEPLGIAAVNFHAQGWEEERARRELRRILDETGRETGIVSAAISTGLPFGTGNPSAALSIPGRPTSGRGNAYTARVVAGTPAIFRTLGVPILAGRSFDDRDQAGAESVIVINETAARGLFGTVDAVGRALIVQKNALGGDRAGHAMTVVGIARDTDGGRYLSDRKYPTVYMPFSQIYHPFLTITARGSDSGAALLALQQAIRKASPDVAIEYIGSGRTILTGPYVFLRAMGTMAVGLGGLTLLLAMVGLFGIQSHTVAHRTREIGVRMTFGATAAQIKRMVIKDGYIPVLQGLAIGVFIGFTGRAIIRSYMDADISIVDPWMFLVVPIPLILAAFCACYWPARRASKVDPQVALRAL
jgi:putative ABC transport system permease protein